MKMRVLPIYYCAVAALLLPVASFGEEYLLYQPTPATGEKVPASPEEGVLVKTVTVHRGDTLTKIARQHIGKGWLFPQVLLFTKIENPNLIYPGDKLLVPVSGGGESAVGSRKRSAHRKKHRGSVKVEKQRPVQLKPGERKPTEQKLAPERKARGIESPRVKEAAPSPRAHVVTDAEQAMYQSAKMAYSKGDFRQAADLFSDFLRRYPDSSLAADVALYRADSFLRLSGQ